MALNGRAPVKSRPHWAWWAILGGLLLWNVILLMPKNRPELALSYSQFVSEIKQGNVASVQISGSEITGNFVKPIPVPTVTAALSESQGYQRFPQMDRIPANGNAEVDEL
jgi:ATP-dependent Zn protease